MNFFVHSEKTKILDQNIFLHKFCFTKGLPIILKYVLALCMVFVTPYRLFQYLHPKGIKFDFFFIKNFQGIAEISAQKCTFWVQILKNIYISQSMPHIAHFTFGSCQKILSITKVTRKFIGLPKNDEKLVCDRTKIFTRHFQYKKLLC